MPAITNRRTAPTDDPDADFYATPAWATRALLDVEHFHGDVEDPACGDGAMAKVLEERCSRVLASDKYDRGYGAVRDFLERPADERVDNIVTNPPYDVADRFVGVALPLVRRKLALLLRLAYLEGSARWADLFSLCPPSRVWVFSDRVTMYRPGAERRGRGTTAYAWYVWDAAHGGPTILRWIPPTGRRDDA